MGDMLIDVDYARMKCVKNRRSHEEEGEGGGRNVMVVRSLMFWQIEKSFFGGARCKIR